MNVSPVQTYPLLPSQVGIWLGHTLAPLGTEYTVAEQLRLRGPLQAAAMRTAIGALCAEAHVLGARIEREGARQLLGHPVPLTVQDLTCEADPGAAAAALLGAALDQPIDLATGPISHFFLLRLSTDEHIVALRSHHVALDGYGFGLLWQRLAELYQEALGGPAGAALPPLPSLIAQEGARAEAPAQAEARDFLLRALDLGPHVRRSLRAPQAPARGLRSEGATEVPLASPSAPHAAHRVAAAFAHTMAARLQREDVLLGVPLLARNDRAALRTPCSLMNLLPLPVHVPPGRHPDETARQLAAGLQALKPHSHYRYEDLRHALGLDGRSDAFFDAVINILPFSRRLRFAGLTCEHARLLGGPVECPTLTIPLSARGAVDRVELELHPEDAQEQAPRALLQELAEHVRHPHPQPLTAAPRSTLSGPPLQRPPRDVVTRFFEVAQRWPERPAVEHGDEVLTYDELALQVLRLAEGLRLLGIEPGNLVAIALPRSIDAIVSQLAVLSVGAAYLPLDAQAPLARNRRILERARPKQLLVAADAPTSQALAPECTTLTALRARTSGAGAFPTAPEQADAGALAYVLFTSGSTGTPNGVQVERGALAHFVAAATDAYGLGDEERVLQFAGLHFDASVEEIFVTLCSGSTLVLRTDAMLHSLPALLDGCTRAGITVLDLPTALFHELATWLEADTRLPPSLRTVIIGGEAAQPERVRRFLQAAPKTLRLLNTYGPTECTVVATCQPLHASDALALSTVPIGAPLPGLAAHVLDGQLRPVPTGSPGQLCLSGPTLSRGYLDAPMLTERRFVTRDGLRLYRTGDRVRLRADGVLLFEGRIDDEVKISGQRVEPAQVEHALCELPEVAQAAVLPLPGARPSLAAALVQAPGSARPRDADVRDALAQTLLQAAIPRRLLWLDRLPRNGSGKVDKAALRIALAEAEEGQPDWQPRPGLEATVTALWLSTLELTATHPDDDFFALGGRSLQAIALASQLSKALSRPVQATLIFSASRLSDLFMALQDEGESAPRVRLSAIQLPQDVQPRPNDHFDAPCVLLTGSTGFVGRAILQHLLDLERQPEVVCLIRAADAAEADARLRAALAPGTSPSRLGRVRALPADLARPRFGLSADDYDALAARCTAVVHAGASVSLLQDYASLYPSNVEATLNVLRFATTGRPKGVHHVSTLAVAMGLADDGLTPERFVNAHGALRDGYQQTKWAAEELVRQAVARGVPARVYRLGRVVPDPEDHAAGNDQDLLHRILRLGLSRGLLPGLDVAEVWTPVGRIGQVLASAATAVAPPRSAPVVHLCDDTVVDLGSFFERLRHARPDLAIVAPGEFRARVGDANDADEAATLSFFDQRKGGDAVTAKEKPERKAFCSLAASLGCASGPDTDRLLDAEARRALKLRETPSRSPQGPTHV